MIDPNVARTVTDWLHYFLVYRLRNCRCIGSFVEEISGVIGDSDISLLHLERDTERSTRTNTQITRRDLDRFLSRKASYILYAT